MAAIQKQIYDALVREGTDQHASALAALARKLYNVTEVGPGCCAKSGVAGGRSCLRDTDSPTGQMGFGGWGRPRRCALPTRRQLFEQFAVPFKLNECALALVQTSGYRDADLVERLWRSIISREPTADRLAAKVAELGQRFRLAETVFPVPGIAFLLEAHAFRAGAAFGAPGWAVRALAAAGVSDAHLFDVYRRLAERVRAADRCPRGRNGRTDRTANATSSRRRVGGAYVPTLGAGLGDAGGMESGAAVPSLGDVHLRPGARLAGAQPEWSVVGDFGAAVRGPAREAPRRASISDPQRGLTPGWRSAGVCMRAVFFSPPCVCSCRVQPGTRLRRVRWTRP